MNKLSRTKDAFRRVIHPSVRGSGILTNCHLKFLFEAVKQRIRNSHRSEGKYGKWIFPYLRETIDSFKGNSGIWLK